MVIGPHQHGNRKLELEFESPVTPVDTILVSRCVELHRSTHTLMSQIIKSELHFLRQCVLGFYFNRFRSHYTIDFGNAFNLTMKSIIIEVKVEYISLKRIRFILISPNYLTFGIGLDY